METAMYSTQAEPLISSSLVCSHLVKHGFTSSFTHSSEASPEGRGNRNLFFFFFRKYDVTAICFWRLYVIRLPLLKCTVAWQRTAKRFISVLHMRHSVVAPWSTNLFTVAVIQEGKGRRNKKRTRQRAIFLDFYTLSHVKDSLYTTQSY